MEENPKVICVACSQEARHECLKCGVTYCSLECFDNDHDTCRMSKHDYEEIGPRVKRGKLHKFSEVMREIYGQVVGKK